MKIPAIAAGGALAAVMMGAALSPHAQHAVEREVRNTVRAWEAPLPPVARVGINFALNEMGIPMLSRHCVAPSLGPEAFVSVTLQSYASGATPSRGCPKPHTLRAVHTGVLVDNLPGTARDEG